MKGTGLTALPSAYVDQRRDAEQLAAPSCSTDAAVAGLEDLNDLHKVGLGHKLTCILAGVLAISGNYTSHSLLVEDYAARNDAVKMSACAVCWHRIVQERLCGKCGLLWCVWSLLCHGIKYHTC